jgi:uncharacterized membrane protein
MVKNLYSILQILLVAIFAMLATLFAYSSDAIWADEVYSLAPTLYGWSEILHIQSGDVHPPFYFLMIKLWLSVFGHNIFAAKIFSVLPTVLALIAGMYFLSREFSEKASVVFALCFLASSPIMHYAIEIRMYAWALFLVEISLICLYYIIMENKLKYWILFLIFAELSAYTHYLACGYLGICYTMFFIYTIVYKRILFKRALIFGLIIFSLYIPQILTLLEYFSNSDTGYTPITRDGVFILGTILHNLRNIINFGFSLGSTFANTDFFYGIYFSLMAHFCVINKNKKEYFMLFAFFSVALFILAMIVMTLISDVRAMTYRYVFPTASAIWLSFAIAASKINNKKIISALCSIIIAFSLYNNYAAYKIYNQEHMDFVNFHNSIQGQIKPDDIFVIQQTDLHSFSIFPYLFPGHKLFYEYTPQFGINWWGQFNKLAEVIPYSKLDEQFIQGKNLWLIHSNRAKEHNLNENVQKLVSDKNIFCRNFGWGDYYVGTTFNICYLEANGNQ